MSGGWRAAWVTVAIGAALSCNPRGSPRAEREVLPPEPPVTVAATSATPRPSAAAVATVARSSATSVAGATAAPTAEASASAAPRVEEDPPVRQPLTAVRDRDTSGRERVEGAEARKGDLVRGLFERAGVGFPPRQLLLRAFKREERLEVWASDGPSGPLTHVTTYGICYASGELGPKRREGDLQVPEGFYTVSWFKAKSSYHLAMQVSYPNRSDRILGHPTEPGGEIMIHGSCVSVGCLAMSDDRIEELWVIARAAPRPVRVHIFPTRDLDGLIASASHPEHQAFWRNLKEGYDRFERTRELFDVQVGRDGRYRFP